MIELFAQLQKMFDAELDILSLAARSYWMDVPDGVTPADYHAENKRKCVTCRAEFFGSARRIECRQCTGEPTFGETK